MEAYRNRESKQAMPDGIRIARRGALYLVRTMMLIFLGCIICILAFMSAQRVGNIYIIASEGMSLRANRILGTNAGGDLAEYFTATWLAADGELAEKTYSAYSVSSVGYDLSVKRFNVMPWGSSATIVADERVKFKASLRDGQTDGADGDAAPQWTPKRYRISFLNIGGRWLISDLTVLSENPSEGAMGTPDLSRTPIIGATPSPVPSPTVKPLPVSTARAEDVMIIE